MSAASCVLGVIGAIVSLCLALAAGTLAYLMHKAEQYDPTFGTPLETVDDKL